jgi:hypothetical protein
MGSREYRACHRPEANALASLRRASNPLLEARTRMPRVHMNSSSRITASGEYVGVHIAWKPDVFE